MSTTATATRDQSYGASIGLLATRVILGIVFAAHGWQKVHDMGFAGSAEAFRGMGAPLPEITGPAIGLLELIGGILLILGLGTRIVGGLLVLDMLGAFFLVHVSAGLFVTDGGWELVGVLAAGALALVAVGPGTLSIDRVVRRKKR